jgi:hypothetical protein
MSAALRCDAKEEKKIVGWDDDDMAPSDLLSKFTSLKMLQHVPLVILQEIVRYCAPFNTSNNNNF